MTFQNYLAMYSFAIASASAFQVKLPVTSSSRDLYIQSTLYMSAPTTPQEMFSSEGWAPIKKELDSLPIFCCANEKGQPLQYNVNAEATMPFFYCDLKSAEEELVKAKNELPEELSQGLGIIPFPLGNAFELMANNQAAIIPSPDAIEAAGAPPGTNPMGQQVPLFCCMDIMQETPEGKTVLPLFMVKEEAERAMMEAVQTDGGNPEEFEIVSLSLPRAVELLATVPDAPSFHFLPPRASIEYIQRYLEN